MTIERLRERVAGLTGAQRAMLEYLYARPKVTFVNGAKIAMLKRMRERGLVIQTPRGLWMPAPDVRQEMVRQRYAR